MGFEFDKKKISIKEVLEGTEKDIKANIDLLAKDYKAKTGRDVCRSCPSDVQYMLLTLKNIYKMTQFKFKRAVAQYKNQKGDKTTISNSNLTDEKAIEFLRTNPERIKLFSEYPSNWETLIIDGVDSETEEEKEARLAAEAEAKALEQSNGNPEAGQGGNAEETEEEKEARLAAEEAEAEAEAAAKAAEAEANKASEEKPNREDLLKMKLADLRAKYPEIKATSIDDFVNKVLA